MTKGVIVDIHGEALSSKASTFTGATNGFGNELATWNASTKSIDSALLPLFDTANARSIDLSRNHGYAKSGVQLHIDHIVGHQFKLVYKPNWAVLGLDRKNKKHMDFVRDVEARFTDIAEDPECFLDAERKRTFTMMMREGAGTHCKTGELTSKVEAIKSKGSRYLTAIKQIHYSRICNPNNKMDSQRLRAGVASNKHGAAIGYHIRKGYVNDIYFNRGESYKWVYTPRYLPWGRLQFIHLFEPEDADQTRGVNNLLATMSKMKMLEKFQSTTLQNAIINAMYAAVIESDLPSEEVFRALNGTSQDSTNDVLASFMNAKANWHEQTNITLNGSRIAHLLPSEKFKLQGVNSPSTILNDFEKGMVRYMAASLGVSYEQLSKNFADANYSSARAAILESFRYFLGKRASIISRYASFIFALWFEEAVNIGTIKLPAGSPNFYEYKYAWTKCGWIGAGLSQIDGLKEVKAAVLRLEKGLSTYEKEYALMGEDYIEAFEQQLRESEILKEQGRTALWMGKSSNVSDDENKDSEDDEKEVDESPGVNENESID